MLCIVLLLEKLNNTHKHPTTSNFNFILPPRDKIGFGCFTTHYIRRITKIEEHGFFFIFFYFWFGGGNYTDTIKHTHNNSHVVGVGRLGGRDDILVGGVGLPVGDVVPDRPGEEDGFLHNNNNHNANVFFITKGCVRKRDGWRFLELLQKKVS